VDYSLPLGDYDIKVIVTIHQDDDPSNNEITLLLAFRKTLYGDATGDYEIDIYDIILICGRLSAQTKHSDINLNGIVHDIDVRIVAQARGSTPGSPNWNPDADLDNDGDVDTMDLLIVTSEYGSSGDPNYISNFDFNCDHVIDAQDFPFRWCASAKGAEIQAFKK